jgi:hypothetical protein
MMGSMEPDARKRQIMIWVHGCGHDRHAGVPLFLLSYTQIETIPYSAFERLLSAELTLNHRSMRALATKTPSGR